MLWGDDGKCFSAETSWIGSVYSFLMFFFKQKIEKALVSTPVCFAHPREERLRVFLVHDHVASQFLFKKVCQPQKGHNVKEKQVIFVSPKVLLK